MNQSKIISKKEKDHQQMLNANTRGELMKVLRIVWRNPKRLWFFLKSIWQQKKALHTRKKWHKKGILVPEILILSITNACNLTCSGCYHRHFSHSNRKEMPLADIDRLIRSAAEIGISWILIAGGEPLNNKNIFYLSRKYPKIIFPLFTNGLLIDDKVIQEFSRQSNLIPIISIEGDEKETDLRRGNGTFNCLQMTIKKLDQQKLLFGVSITVSQQNFNKVTDENFFLQLMAEGIRIFILVEYVPVEKNAPYQVLTPELRQQLLQRINHCQKRFKRAVMITFPGDETPYGGCLAGGRGFIHVNAFGDLEACPFAPFSDVNITETPLVDALNSSFLMKIRQNHQQLIEREGGCALWKNRHWVQSLLNK